MARSRHFVTTTALIVALGGFLMGFDASVISGVVGFIQVEFSLTSIQPGWAVSSLALTATLGMMLSAPLSDRVGRRPVLFDFPAAAFLVTPFMRPPPGDKGPLPRGTGSGARSGLT